MRKLLGMISILLIPFLLSCVRFAVVSPTTKASSTSISEISVDAGIYARYFQLQTRKGLYRDRFLGTEIGLFLSYAIQDEYFGSISSMIDGKISLFESSKSKFATGLGLSYLNIYEKMNNTNFQMDCLYLVFPTYMESSLTEWFRFIVNFRFFNNIYNATNVIHPISNYGTNFLTVNVGIELFNVFTINGYIVSGNQLASFPLPGFSLGYTFGF
ncbi:MAG: hypothetical protein N3D81_01990 [Spirochaetes bacterium]|nr:hypothetical protein [Spirochaetota bacterium]